MVLLMITLCEKAGILMSRKTEKHGAFSLKKGETAALEGKGTDSLLLLLQGKLDVFIQPFPENYPENYMDLENKCYRIFELDGNIFIGADDMLRNGKNSLSYSAADNCSMFAYKIGNAEEVLSLIHTQKDYGAYTINSISNLICKSYNALQKISSYVSKAEALFDNLSVYYRTITNEYRLNAIPGELVNAGNNKHAFFIENNITVPLYFSRQFIETMFSDSSGYLLQDIESSGRVKYFIHLYNLQIDIKKTFFSADRYITESHLNAASELLGKILQKLRYAFSSLEKLIKMLYSDNEGCAYKAFVKAAFDMANKGLDYSPSLDAAVYIYEKLKSMASEIEIEYKHKSGIDFKYLDHLHTNTIEALEKINTATGNILTGESMDIQLSLPEELINSAARIVEYSEIPEDKATYFLMNLSAFRNLNDRMSSDETAQSIRKAVTDVFFDIYKAVFLKAHRLKDNSRLIKMFLNFGYMDEKLLDNDQTLAVYKLAGIEKPYSFQNMYYAWDWFSAIYQMEKAPSINQFGQDYNDVFRELKKRGQVDEKDKAAYDNDAEGKLAFEIDNMFRTNHKLCQGQILAYFPILHRDMAPANPLRSVVTPGIIQEKLNRILEIDYSAFHREIYYMNQEKNIEKELVMIQVKPDIMFMPVYGSRAIMWQEITGRVRSSPGRFLIPVFTDENIDDMLVKLVGNFRWELCRTMMGSAWNDVTQSSLTADYTDYIQFYRKNRDLSEDAKEKIKSQCAKYHNKMRDIFTSDYELWINNESKGNPRLNKVARSIFFKHCPFSINVLTQLEKYPMFADLKAVRDIQRAKMVRELENRYKLYRKRNNGVLDPVLENNLKFYRDM